jgi:hypothetical protein
VSQGERGVSDGASASDGEREDERRDEGEGAAGAGDAMDETV